MCIDMMLVEVLKRSKEIAAEFCGRRSKVCAGGCRTAVGRERTLFFGARF
jgi:hypothetical protein